MKILLTGQPHAGKTTLMAKLIRGIGRKHGFVTEEIPDTHVAGQRLGFRLVDHAGRTEPLAHVGSESPIKVSKYGVDVDALDRFMEPLFEIEATDVLYIDEIGQMELYSERFKELVNLYIGAENDFLGTLTSVYDDDYVRRLRDMPGVTLIEVTPHNRDELYVKLSRRLAKG